MGYVCIDQREMIRHVVDWARGRDIATGKRRYPILTRQQRDAKEEAERKARSDQRTAFRRRMKVKAGGDKKLLTR